MNTKSQHYFFKILSCITILAGLSLTTDAQELFKASVFTPPKSFTSDVEGPAVDKAGNIYAVNFARQVTIGIITPEGVPSVFIELPQGSIANSIRFDSHQNMFIGDYTKHNVFKVDMKTKKLTTLAFEPKMYQPNDMAIDKKNRLYASDPNFKGKGRIWRVDPKGKVTLLDSMAANTNGIEISPDGKILYVNASRTIYAYDLSSKGVISNKRTLIEFTDNGVDGMRCDIDGNIYIARFGRSKIEKVSPQGKILQEIKLTGRQPTNICFGGPDGRTAYVTLMDQGNLETFRVDLPGREWKMSHK